VKITDWVLDADTHITEPPDVWTARLPKKYVELGPLMVRLDDGRDIWRIGDSEQIVPIGLTAIAGWPEPFPSAPRNFDEIPKAAYESKARLAYMDEVGIWAMALYPNIGGFGNQAFLEMDDPELRIACVRAYNDWLVDWCSIAPERFIKIAAIPFWDLNATLAEIERCADLGFKGILFTGEPQALGQPLLGDRHWDPLYMLAGETQMALNFHIGGGDIDRSLAVQRAVAHGITSTLASSSIELFLGNAIQVSDLLLSGVLPRHPDTKFVSVESGIGWVPFVLEAADYCFEYAEIRRERPEFELLPSEYFRRQVYACAFFEEYAPKANLDRIGPENILFETDYPHPTCLFGNIREKVDVAYGEMDPATARRILYDNTAELYGVGQPDRPWHPEG
jgi:predicted TIM-barrel fold metal-dependent hydrolase